MPPLRLHGKGRCLLSQMPGQPCQELRGGNGTGRRRGEAALP
jgi:hypothetical protein